MSSYIHILELATLALFGLLVYRLAACYREFYASDSAEIESAAVQNEIGISSVAQTTAISGSEAILNDYIGEFFAGEEPINISAYKSPVVGNELNESEVASGQIDDEEHIVVEVPEHLIPTLDAVVSLESDNDDMEDDSIILVAQDLQGDHSANENVMSEKVVHAMLDEAKLVCAS